MGLCDRLRLTRENGKGVKLGHPGTRCCRSSGFRSLLSVLQTPCLAPRVHFLPTTPPPPHTHTQALLQNGWHKGTSQMGSSDRAPRCPRVTAAVCEPLRCRGPGRDVGCFTGCPAPLDAFRDVSLLLVMASAVRKLCGQGSYNWECIYGRPYSCLGKY